MTNIGTLQSLTGIMVWMGIIFLGRLATGLFFWNLKRRNDRDKEERRVRWCALIFAVVLLPLMILFISKQPINFLVAGALVILICFLIVFDLIKLIEQKKE